MWEYNPSRIVSRGVLFRNSSQNISHELRLRCYFCNNRWKADLPSNPHKIFFLFDSHLTAPTLSSLFPSYTSCIIYVCIWTFSLIKFEMQMKYHSNELYSVVNFIKEFAQQSIYFIYMLEFTSFVNSKFGSSWFAELSMRT